MLARTSIGWRHVKIVIAPPIRTREVNGSEQAGEGSGQENCTNEDEDELKMIALPAKLFAFVLLNHNINIYVQTRNYHKFTVIE
jgi:hypothetical protein